MALHRKALTSLSLLAIAVLAISVAGSSKGRLFASTTYAATPAEQGQAIFEQKCKGCHTIGGGRTVGPDLKGVTGNRDRDWLIRFITSPDRLIAEGDSIAKQLIQQFGVSMPNLGVSANDAENILAYLDAQSGSKPSQPSAPPLQPAAQGNAETGRNIFLGKQPLQNGGPACIACHNIGGIGMVGGGTVAKDLTNTYASAGGAGITAVLKTTPFPIMRNIYKDKPFTDDEVINLVAFLKEAGSSQQTKSPQNPIVFFLFGGIGFVVVIGLFQVIWRRRLSGVRQPLVKGGSK